MILIIDFDGTIVEEAYPNVGELMPNVKEVINKLYDEGHKIIVETCRTGRYEGEAVDCLLDNGIKFHYVNCNLPSQIEKYKMDCRKLSGDVRIDNIGLCGIPRDWDEIYKIIQKHPKYENGDN